MNNRLYSDLYLHLKKIYKKKKKKIVGYLPSGNHRSNTNI